MDIQACSMSECLSVYVNISNVVRLCFPVCLKLLSIVCVFKCLCKSACVGQMSFVWVNVYMSVHMFYLLFPTSVMLIFHLHGCEGKVKQGRGIPSLTL